MRYLYWMSIVIVSVGTASVVYGPHTLQGETRASPFPPRRIVSLTLAADEMLLALAPPARIAALTRLASDPRFSNVVAEARDIPGKVWANGEQVLVFQPDLVIVATYTSATAKRLLREAGIPLLELGRYDSLAAVQENILAVGRAIGELDRAHSLVADMQRRLQRIRQQVEAAPRPGVVAYAVGGFVAGKGTIFDDMITTAGGHNLATEAGVIRTKKISQETLVALNPDVILVGEDLGDEGFRAQLLADPTLQTVAAIQTGRVQAIPRAHLGTLSHHIVKGVEAMARALHPRVFSSTAERRG